LSCVKVNANIYCVHSASFQSLVKDSPEFTQGGRRLLHNIKAVRLATQNSKTLTKVW
jgi:hypothetical protein